MVVMANLKPTEIVLILLVVLLLFGAKRLPDLAKSVGKSLKILKHEVKDLRDDDEPPARATDPAATLATGAATTPMTTPITTPGPVPATAPETHTAPAVGPTGALNGAYPGPGTGAAGGDDTGRQQR
jgi:sec-independent protein translocase protein TatA